MCTIICFSFIDKSSLFWSRLNQIYDIFDMKYVLHNVIDDVSGPIS